MSSTQSEPVQRYECTADAPWSEDKGRYALHPDAKVIHEDYDRYSGANPSYHTAKCPHCGLIFTYEIPS